VTTHDVLAFAVALETVRDIRNLSPQWSPVFSANVHVTTSRAWPQPDFVIHDQANKIALAAEFKPPAQSKREYLTGLGQAVAYTRDFTYAALVIPDYADDGYPIGDHVRSVLELQDYAAAPIALLTYDPAVLSPTTPICHVARTLTARSTALRRLPPLSPSFYAKWREASADELGRYLNHLYDEGRAPASARPIRDRAFDSLWNEIVSGATTNLAGSARKISNTGKNRIAWDKNFRNFMSHLDWTLGDGALTDTGLTALHLVHRYGADSRVFLDLLSTSVLVNGKHLVLINAINDYQNEIRGSFPDESAWLVNMEEYLEDKGLLKRNPGRHAASIQNVQRGFLKAEKTLWRALELIIPRGYRAFHPGRGFIFNWERITGLLSQ
jgi:hypothetical protein